MRVLGAEGMSYHYLRLRVLCAAGKAKQRLRLDLLEMFVLARTVSVDSVAEGLHSSSEATCDVKTRNEINVVERRFRPKKQSTSVFHGEKLGCWRE